MCLLHPGMVGAVVVGDGEGPAGASLSIEQVDTTQPDAGAADSSAADPAVESAPASATEDSGMSTLLIMALVAGAAMILYVLATWVRRRFAAHDPRPVA